MRKTVILTLFLSALVSGCMAEDEVGTGDLELRGRDYQTAVHVAIRNLGIDGYACTLDARGTKSCVVDARSGETLSCSSEVDPSDELQVCSNGTCGPLTAAYDCEDGECSCQTLIDCIKMSNEMCEGELICDENGCTCEY